MTMMTQNCYMMGKVMHTKIMRELGQYAKPSDPQWLSERYKAVIARDGFLDSLEMALIMNGYRELLVLRKETSCQATRRRKA